MDAYRCDSCKQVFLLTRPESSIPMRIYLNNPNQNPLDICKNCSERIMNLIQMKNLASEMDFAHRDEGRIE